MNTRSYLLFSLAILLCLPMLGQRQRFRPQVHEIGVQLYSLRAVPTYNVADEIVGWKYGHDPLNAIRYKYHIDPQTAIRSSLSYHIADYARDRGLGNPDWHIYQARWVGGDFSLGLERYLNLRKVKLFAGVDAVLGRAQISEFSQDNIQFTEIRQEFTTWNYGISGVLGFRYLFSSYNSLTLESNVSYLMNNQSRSHQGGDAELASLRYDLGTNGQILASPINIYFSYHFKKMKKRCKCPKR